MPAPVQPDSAPRVALAVPARPRRRQADRTAETRVAVIAAVVDSIAELGFARTTAAEIARRAGVTWGAVQHHFGGKDGLLVAVLEDSFNRYAARFDDIDATATTLDERIGMFVGRAWEHYRSKDFRSTFEILLNYLGRTDIAEHSSWREEMFRSFDGVWLRVFFDAPLAEPERFALEQYTFSVLSGLAATRMLQTGQGTIGRESLALLEDTLRRGLGAA